MPTKLCLHPRCPNPQTYRGRCSSHARAREAETHPRKTVYNSARWKYLRHMVLFEHPICQHCENALAVDVDHITPIEQGGQPYERANVQALCKQCHGRKTKREQATT